MQPCKTFSNLIRPQNHIKFIGIEEFQTELFRCFALYVHLCIYTHTHTLVSSLFLFLPLAPVLEKTSPGAAAHTGQHPVS